VAVSPLRALAVAQWHSSLAVTRRQLGATTQWILFALFVAFVVVGFLPFLPAAAFGGFFLARAVSTLPPVVLATVSLAISAITVSSAVIFGASAGSTRQLPWESLRAFPLRLRTLFWAEFFANAADITTAVYLFIFAAFTVGLCAGRPLATPLFLGLFASHAVLILAIKIISAGVAQRLLAKVKFVVVLLPVVAISMATLPAVLFNRSSDTGHNIAVSNQAKSDLKGRATDWAIAASTFTPTRPFLKAAQSAAAGQPTPPDLLGLGLVLLLVVAAIGLAYWLTVSERGRSQHPLTVKPKPLWTFTRPEVGIARLQLYSIAHSRIGQFGLFFPLITILLLRGPLARLAANSPWSTSAAFAYAALASTNLLFNQFGLDRHGVKVLFLLPVSSRTLLLGKWLGFGVWQSVQLVLLIVLFLLSGQRSVVALTTGALVNLAAFFILSIIGQFCSIWQPRPLDRDSMRKSSPSLSVSVLTLGTVAVIGLVVSAVLFGIGFLAPGFEIPFLALVLFALIGIAFTALPLNASYLTRRREKLLETLASSG
jgi:hypothetical protein